MPQETESICPHQASLSPDCNQVLSDDDAPFEVIVEEDAPLFVDCEKSASSSTGIIQKATGTSSEPQTTPPMGSIVESPHLLDTQRLIAALGDSCRDLPTSVNKTSQGLLTVANSPANIPVDRPTALMLLPNTESQALANYDQSAAEDITPIAVDPVPEAITASTTTEEDQEQPEMPTTMAPVEERAVVEVQLKALCDKLQKGFLTPGQQPDPDYMCAMARHLTYAESMHQPPVCVAARKFLKVLKAISKLDHIPRDEEFGLKERAKALREKWLDALGDVVLPRREPERIIIDLTDSADESPQSAGNNVLNSPASSETISPPASGRLPTKRKRGPLTDSSSSSPEMGRGKRKRVTKIHLKAHFDQENTVMQNCLRNVYQMIEGVSAEMERAQARKEQLESLKDELEAWGIREEKVTRQLEKQS